MTDGRRKRHVALSSRRFSYKVLCVMRVWVHVIRAFLLACLSAPACVDVLCASALDTFVTCDHHRRSHHKP